MMNIKNTTVSKDAVEDVEDFLHGTGIILIAAMELGEGVYYYQSWLEIGHDLNEISDVVGVVHHIEGSA